MSETHKFPDEIAADILCAMIENNPLSFVTKERSDPEEPLTRKFNWDEILRGYSLIHQIISNKELRGIYVKQFNESLPQS